MMIAVRVAARYLQARANPLPTSFPKTEIGLMTKEEFLAFRNPEDKHHNSESYDFDVFHLNEDHPRQVGTQGSHGSDMVTVYQLSGGYEVMKEGAIIGVIHNGVAYFDKPHLKGRIPKYVLDHMGKQTDLGVTSYKQVKYLSEVMPLISPIAKLNEAKYPVVLQHIIVKGEAMSVRAEKQPKTDSGVTLAIFNADGLVVAQASNEWGATLLAVAQEYRGKGLGKIIGQFWYELNPSFTSGGFTPAGERNALALWRDRVHEFSAQGWYSDLVREGKLSLSKVKQILAEAGEKPEHIEREQTPEAVKATGDILVYSDGDITFIVYDRAFLQEPDEKFIHGFGFFRDAPDKGVFLYRIEYDRPFADLTTRVALQMARDNGEELYDGDGYHDLVEINGLPGVVKEGDYIKVTQNLIQVKVLAAKERRVRKAVDQYGEKESLLLEMAESKWS
jgi:GNAT superfamily N-acetyltransferase